MANIKKSNFTKKNISNNIQQQTGISKSFSDIVTDDLIEIIKIAIKKDTLNIKNFGTFKILHKKERVGRNPKTGNPHIINARKSISFSLSKKIDKLIKSYNG